MPRTTILQLIKPYTYLATYHSFPPSIKRRPPFSFLLTESKSSLECSKTTLALNLKGCIVTPKMKMQSSFFIVLVTLLHTTSAQLSPVQPPKTSPPAPKPQSPAASPPAFGVAPTTPTAVAPSPGMSTVPLVPVTPSAAPVTPNAAPTPAVHRAPGIDVVTILTKAKRFSVLVRLLKSTQLVNQLNSQLSAANSGGLTLFTPDDGGFAKLKAGFLNSLNDRQKVELLQFHSINTFIAISNFDTLTNPVQTQAGDDGKRLQLNITSYGGSQVSMTTGVVNASVTGTVYSDNKLAIYQVDKVLLPVDLVVPHKAPAPAPALAAAKGDLPKPDVGDDSAKAPAADQSGRADDKDKGKSDDGQAGAVTVDASGALSLSFSKGVALVLGVVFVAA
ncbi:hypothetical protein L6164_021956 [Bauhinia variegata]|uniref:Uncharacterized protein n=1 Tax=Bauhinia variegata TaxID=167791 RepID=A0ACB9MEM6_BAUVA|nr:hypothetical protein L6164_021956 [Bauhinia variegata]